MSRRFDHADLRVRHLSEAQGFHAFAAFREPPDLAAALRSGTRHIDETLAFVDRAFLTQRIGQLGENVTQHLSLIPLLKLAMDGFVVGIALGQHVPLCTGVQNPEHRLQDVAGGHRLAPRSAVRNVLFGEMLPNPSHWSSRKRSMRAHYRDFIYRLNYFEIGSYHFYHKLDVMSAETSFLPPHQANKIDSCHIRSRNYDGPEHDGTLLGVYR